MALAGQPRPRISRETRLLLATVVLSLGALWLLARVRFPERPATPNPVPPLLTQLAPRPAFEDLASAVAQLEPDVLPTLILLGTQRAAPTGDPPVRHAVPALRFRDDAAVAWLDTLSDVQTDGGALLARDPATGLAVVRTAPSVAPPLRIWTPARMQYPRYVIVSDVSLSGISLRPVFLGALRATTDRLWPASVWTVPSHAGIPAGAFVFTTTGLLAGLVVGQPGTNVIVPGDTLIAAAQRLLSEEQKESGRLGVEVQALAPEIGAATGATTGVVVTWVDPQGPAAQVLTSTDVIEAIGGDPVATPADWDARLARLKAGETLALRVRRAGQAEEVHVTAVPPPAPPARSLRLGLTLRSRSRIGAEVTRVEDGSVAARAGIRIGDVVTKVAEITAPTPADVNRAFSALPSGSAVLAAITRGRDHTVVALVKQ